MQQTPVIWLSNELQAQCSREADRMFPDETGGVFMGYWHAQDIAVVTAAIGPGPNAVHQRYNFEPDYEWQLRQIADHYEQSLRRETYLGDWHSHPGAHSGRLSYLDRQVLRRIITTPAARTDVPIMAIFYGNREEWHLTAWCARLSPRPFLWPKLTTAEAALRPF